MSPSPKTKHPGMAACCAASVDDLIRPTGSIRVIGFTTSLGTVMSACRRTASGHLGCHGRHEVRYTYVQLHDPVQCILHQVVSERLASVFQGGRVGNVPPYLVYLTSPYPTFSIRKSPRAFSVVPARQGRPPVAPCPALFRGRWGEHRTLTYIGGVIMWSGV